MQPPLPVTIHATYMFAAYLTGRRVCVYHGERLAVRIDIDSHCQSDAASQQSVAAAQAQGRGLSEPEQAAILSARSAQLRFPLNAPDFRGTGGGNGALADAHSILEVSERFRPTPLQNCLSTPELQGDSRGQWRVLRGGCQLETPGPARGGGAVADGGVPDG